ncbi:SEL1-like repeat protein [Pinirhizobacter sp.]|uniref:SEL1-like repeat protein n=1 Tax=Pinirhizobacter sp. TaxID=2950432 RepID=UPI002F3FC074
MKRISLVIALALSGVGMTAMAGEEPKPLPGQEKNAAMDQQPCPDGLERMLPGNYYFCEGVRSFWDGNRNAALYNLQEAASWGSKRAQYALGVAYFNGDQLPKNRPLGLAWLTLAAERKTPVYAATQRSAIEHATEAERQQGWQEMQKLKVKYADAVALKRAKTRLHRELRHLSAGSTGNTYTYYANVWNIYADYDNSDLVAELGPQDFGHALPFPIDMHGNGYRHYYDAPAYGARSFSPAVRQTSAPARSAAAAPAAGKGR